MRKVLLITLLFSIFVLKAQNKPVLYGFDNIPQGLLLNPGQETTYRAHLGIPMISGLHASAGISGFTLSDLFGVDGTGVVGNTDFNAKLATVLDNLGTKDYLTVNAQVEVLSGGYKLTEQDYLSVGYYTELDAFVGFPKDLILLGLEGNYPDNIGKTYYASDVAFKADLLGVIHAGITRKFNNRFTGGARLKIYSGALNVTSTRNEGTLTTNEGVNGIYDHNLFNLDVAGYSSGIVDENDETDHLTVGSVFGNTFLSKNFGLGIDLGFTYHMNEQIEFTASLLDVGFLSYSKNTRNFYVNGDYHFSGVDFVYDGNVDYYEEYGQDFQERVAYSDDRESYAVSRPVKFNGSVRYSFGQSRYESTCHDIRMKDYYDNAVGAQFFSVFRPYGMRMAFTGFYERRLADFLNTKVTWTVDDFSATNIGLGISAQVWKFNVYGAINNIFGLNDVTSTNTAGVQFGINLLFN